MKKYSLIAILALLALIMSSCRDLPIDSDPNGGGGWERDDDRDDDKKDPKIDYNYGPGKCFDFVYPVSYLMPDRTRMMFNSREEINIRMNEWHKMHPDFNGKASLVFPVEIIYPDGTVKMIRSQADLDMAKKDCYKDDKDRDGDKDGDRDGDKDGDDKDDDKWSDKDPNGDRPCVTFFYPLTYVTPDGQRVQVNSEEERDMLFEKWSRNTDALGMREPQLMFPIKVMLANGEIVAVYGQDELNKYKKDCDRDDDKDDDRDDKDDDRDDTGSKLR